MGTKTFSFNETPISFDFNSAESVMVNATEMAKLFNKDVYSFLRINSTKDYINAYCRTADLRSEDEFSPKGKLIKIINVGRNNGTWMERSVALKFAAWLSPEFEVWVYKTINDLLFGEYHALDKKITEAAKRKARIQKIKNDLEKDPDVDKRIIELFSLEATEKRDSKTRFYGSVI